MRLIFVSICFGVLVSTVSASFIVDLIDSEVSSLLSPLAKLGVGLTFSQCQLIKRLLHLTYPQYDEAPDMSELTIDFISKEGNITLNIADLADLTNSEFYDKNKGIMIFLHGFTDNPKKESFHTMSTAFLKSGTHNILALDASDYIGFLYLRSSTMVQFIGEALGAGLAALINDGVDPKEIHIVGHSLGSQIGGRTGKTVTEQTGERIGRISGLDPAGPCFFDLKSSERLSKSSAVLVDVIHTNAGVFGLNENIGHMDFYPNGGSQQPGCSLQSCAHSRAWEFFAESVLNKEGFPGVACNTARRFENGLCDSDDYNYMGYGVSADKQGAYYLQTNSAPAYAEGWNGTVYNNNQGLIGNIIRVLPFDI